MSAAASAPTSKENGDSRSEKPKTFSCTSPGCSQTFKTAEQLAIHSQKHQMTLKLGVKASILSDTTTVDQTPTPTRFLHLGNQVGLFDELNPFDREFKSAQKEGSSNLKQRWAAYQQLQLQSGNAGKALTPTTPTKSGVITSDSTYPMPQPLHVITLTPTLPSPVTALPGQFFVPPLIPSPQGFLPSIPGFNTVSSPVPANILSPTIMPYPGFIPGISSPSMSEAQHRAAAAMFAAAVSASSPLVSQPPITMTSHQPIPMTSQYSTLTSTVPTQEHPNEEARVTTASYSTCSILPKQERPVSVSSVNSDSTPADLSHSSSRPSVSLGAATKLTSSNPAQASVPVTRHQQPITLPPIQSVQTHHPVAPPALEVTKTEPPPMHSVPLHGGHPPLVAKSSTDSNSSLIDAKQKLKETLKNNNPGLHVASPLMAQQVDMETNMDVKPMHTSNNAASVSTSSSSEDTKPSGGRRRGRQSTDIDPDIKRQRFLERNRAAASRCRNKKKKWVVGLEHKAKGLAQTNVILQNEIAALKDEIATLKQLLLSHRDCPITKMQQQSMALAGINLDLTSTNPTSSAAPSAVSYNINNGVKSEVSNCDVMGSSFSSQIPTSSHGSSGLPYDPNISQQIQQAQPTDTNGISMFPGLPPAT